MVCRAYAATRHACTHATVCVRGARRGQSATTLDVTPLGCAHTPAHGKITSSAPTLRIHAAFDLAPRALHACVPTVTRCGTARGALRWGSELYTPVGARLWRGGWYGWWDLAVVPRPEITTHTDVVNAVAIGTAAPFAACVAEVARWINRSRKYRSHLQQFLFARVERSFNNSSPNKNKQLYKDTMEDTVFKKSFNSPSMLYVFPHACPAHRGLARGTLRASKSVPTTKHD